MHIYPPKDFETINLREAVIKGIEGDIKNLETAWRYTKKSSRIHRIERKLKLKYLDLLYFKELGKTRKQAHNCNEQ